MVDSGSQLSIVNKGVVGNRPLTACDIILVDAQGRRIQVFGEINLPLRLGEALVYQSCIVADIKPDILLGLNFLRCFECVIDFSSACLYFAGQSIKLNDNRRDLTETQSCSHVTAVAATPERLGVISNLLDRSAEHLSAMQKEEVRELLIEFNEVFSTGDDDLGHTSLVTHRIDTGDAKPIKQSPRRLPLAKREVAQQEIARMLAQGIIQESSSPWASPVVLVDKKQGGVRFCVDYRRLNDVTKKDSYPLPRTDATLDALSGSNWFSTLDLVSGFWQCEMSPEDREKTAFCVEGGLFEFKVMPMGLANSPATFERLMERVFHGVPTAHLLVFLDDLIVHAQDFESELARLREVFRRLRAAGLKLKTSKCQLFKRETVFLGHVVGEAGLKTDPTKTEAVETWPRPRSVSEVRGYLGLCGYYRRFIPRFSERAKALYDLTKKHARFHWTDAQEEAFLDLKHCLTTAPVLQLPNSHAEFILDTDCSQHSIGAVLSQRTDKGERVVAYFSRTLSKTERRYCVTRQELLAMVKSLAHFHVYLYGRKFTLRTDHASLKWLMNFKEPEGQLARWLERLQQYDFIIVHRPGQQHKNADALSRRPCQPGNCSYCQRAELRVSEVTERTPYAHAGSGSEEVQVNMIRIENRDLIEAQDADPVLGGLRQLKLMGAERPQWAEVSRESEKYKDWWVDWDALEVVDEVLCRRWVSDVDGRCKMLPAVPEKLQAEVLKHLHDGPEGGHFGRQKTLARVKAKYYWPHRRRTVVEWCQNCAVCASRKGPNRRQTGPMQLYQVGAPMERVAVDVVGPLPVTDSGNRYLLVAMDYFTKWPEVYALPNQEAITVAQALVEGFFSRFGAPIELHSDQGRNFESAVMTEVCRLFGIHKTRTTAGYPQGDGMVERFNRTLLNSLATVVSQHQRDWDDHVPLVLLAYRTAVHESTGMAPCVAMLGRELRGPVELAIPRPEQEPLPAGTQYATGLREKLELVHDLVRGRLQLVGLQAKARYDRKADTNGFKPGDAVWLFNPRVRRNQSPKLARPWEGPYRVVERVTDVVYRIQLTCRSKPRTVNRYRLWKVTGKLPDDWYRPNDVTNHETTPGDDEGQPSQPLAQETTPGGDEGQPSQPLAQDELPEQRPKEAEQDDAEDEISSNDGEAEADLPPKMTRSGRRVMKPARYRDNA